MGVTRYTSALVTCAIVCLAPWLCRDAQAQNPLSELTVGIGLRTWTNEVNQRLQPGVGFELGQVLYLTRSATSSPQWVRQGWSFGAGVKLGVFSFVARPGLGEEGSAIPFNGDLNTYHVQIGPRVRKVIWDGLFLKGGIDYVRMNTGGSALVQLTGLKRAWHSMATSVSLGFALEPLVIEFEGIHHIIPNLEGNMWGMLVHIGFVNF